MCTDGRSYIDTIFGVRMLPAVRLREAGSGMSPRLKNPKKEVGKRYHGKVCLERAYVGV